MPEYYCTLTDVGDSKIAQAALLGQPLSITHIAVGNGNPHELPPSPATRLVDEQYRAPVGAVYSPPEDDSVVVVEVAIPTTAGGWVVNELALIDEVGDVIAVANYPATWKPVITDGTGRVLLIRVMLDVGSAANVTLQIDPAMVMATRQYVENSAAASREYTDDLVAGVDHCGHCGNKLRGYIRVERINKNHAQLLALLDCLRLVLPLSEPQISHTRTQIIRMAIERQSSISSDHPVVAEFWEVYEYLEGLDADGPVVNHSKKENTIAINLNDFVKCAAEHRQKVADISELRDRLKDSRSRKLIDTNKATDSAVRAHQAKHSNAVTTKQPIVKCWIFQA